MPIGLSSSNPNHTKKKKKKKGLSFGVLSVLSVAALLIKGGSGSPKKRVEEPPDLGNPKKPNLINRSQSHQRLTIAFLDQLYMRGAMDDEQKYPLIKLSLSSCI